MTGGPDGEYGQQYAFMTQASPWEFFYLTPKAAEEEQSNLGLWVAIIVAIVVVAAIVVLAHRQEPSRRPGRGGLACSDPKV